MWFDPFHEVQERFEAIDREQFWVSLGILASGCGLVLFFMLLVL